MLAGGRVPGIEAAFHFIAGSDGLVDNAAVPQVHIRVHGVFCFRILKTSCRLEISISGPVIAAGLVDNAAAPQVCNIKDYLQHPLAFTALLYPHASTAPEQHLNDCHPGTQLPNVLIIISFF